jgi:hypothetical protein
MRASGNPPSQMNSTLVDPVASLSAIGWPPGPKWNCVTVLPAV